MCHMFVNFCKPISNRSSRSPFKFSLARSLGTDMEALYAKLYDKYDKLKTTKLSEIDQSGHEQEEKFLNYCKIAEDLIEHLRSENDKLQTQLNESNDETRNIRSSLNEYKSLLIQECEKTKELSNEVERLQSLQQEGLRGDPVDGNTDSVRKRKRNIDNVHMGSSGGAQVRSEDIATGSMRKKSRLQLVVAEPYKAIPLNMSTGTDSEERSRGGSLLDDDEGLQQVNHSMRKAVELGDSMSGNFLLQTLMESLVGLKLDVVNKEERLCLLAVHQSSGYTFSLTWVSKATEENTELLYHASSFGTIERVALDWMKEDIMFSLSMFPSFLKRLSKVLGLQF